MRRRISDAAFSVNVSVSIWRTSSRVSTVQTKRHASVQVLPVPAPAPTTVSGASDVIASTCSGRPCEAT